LRTTSEDEEQHTVGDPCSPCSSGHGNLCSCG